MTSKQSTKQLQDKSNLLLFFFKMKFLSRNVLKPELDKLLNKTNLVPRRLAALKTKSITSEDNYT